MSAIVIGLAAYVALQFAIGLWVARRIASERDYINAGRQIGPVVGAFTVFATWFGAEAILGTGGAVYAEGMTGATIDPFGYAAALAIAGLLMAMPLWRRGYVTFGDFFRDRFSPGVERLAVLLILPGPLFWAAAQIKAFGHVLGTASDAPVLLAMAIGALIVIAYTTIGGLLADAYTDFIQGVVIIAGLLILGMLVASDMGGLAAAAARIPEEQWRYGEDVPFLELVEQWAIPICGTLVSIELISRMLGARSPQVARQACIAGGVLYALVGLIPVFLGLAGGVLVPGLEDGEAIVPRLAEIYLPAILFIVFSGAILSAILSTVDSALLASGSIVSHNLLQPAFADMNERARLLVTRITVALLGVLAFVIALNSDSIRGLIETASSVGSAGLVVVALLGLYTRLGGPESAYAALVAGVTVWLAGILTEATSVPYLLALAAALAAYVTAAIAWPPTRREPGNT